MATRVRSVRPPSGASAPDEAEEPIDPGFNEAAYLRAFPDIADAVRRGSLPSGLAHYRMTGRIEGRLETAEYRALAGTAASAGIAPRVSVDALTISASGATLLIGWSDDRHDPLTEITLETTPGTRHLWNAFPRLARPDVERAREAGDPWPFGFLLVAAPIGGADAPAINPLGVSAPVFTFASGLQTTAARDPTVASDEDLRDLALQALPAAMGDARDPETAGALLDSHAGVQIATINRVIIERARRHRVIERVGPVRDHYRGSVIVPIRGGAEQVALRGALTATGPGADEYEFIHVIANPDHFEAVLRAARVTARTWGVGQTLVFHPGGDPAGVGEDAAADIAQSDRLIFMDPAIFPRHLDWAARHTALLAGKPPEQTRLFGGLLYRADGSLAHGGYWFDRNRALAAVPGASPRWFESTSLERLAHPAPARAAAWLRPRPVAGVSSAFLSVDRAWFHELGGFTRHYARAAFEDIDLCLRSLKRGVPAWVHDMPMWYLERRAPMRPEPTRGGAILNDWLLQRQWGSSIVPHLLGRFPVLPGAGT